MNTTAEKSQGTVWQSNSLSGEITQQHPLPYSIFLHLLLGVLNGIVFFLLGPIFHKQNLPPFLALSIANLIVLPPFILAFLYYQGHKRNGGLSLDGVVLYRENIRWWEYLVYVPIVFILPPLLILALKPVTSVIQTGLFAWWSPVYTLAGDLSQYPRSTLITSYVINFLSVSLAAPILKEIYFRGSLLPRLSRFGLWAVPINSILFALFHTWTPWMFVARAVGLIPLIFVAQKKRNIYIGMIAHVLVNAVDIATGMIPILNHI